MSQVNTRIQHKHDTEAHWASATNFKPLEGEIIFYDKETVDSEGNQSIIYGYGMKIGDGTNLLSELPFIYYGLNDINTALEAILSLQNEYLPEDEQQ